MCKYKTCIYWAFFCYILNAPRICSQYGSGITYLHIRSLLYAKIIGRKYYYKLLVCVKCHIVILTVVIAFYIITGDLKENAPPA